MRKSISIVGLALLCSGTIGNTAVIGDVNGDDLVGLPEAINALKISAGMTGTVSEDVKVYNFLDYYYQDNAKYVYKETWFDDEYGTPIISFITRTSDIETVEGQPRYSIDWGNGIDYATVSGDTVSFTLFTETGWEDSIPQPPIPFGKTEMKVGDIIPSVYQWESDLKPQFRKYVFEAVENVTTPAGSFDNCLMITREIAGSQNLRVEYFAKSIGLVKRIYISYNYRSSRELVAADIDSTIQLGNEVTTCEGTFSKDGQTVGVLNIAYQDEGNGIYKGSLSADGDWYSNYEITSTDGTTFTCVNNNEGIQIQDCLSTSQGTFIDSWDGFEMYNYTIDLTCSQVGSN
ncbi:hypothetical protein [Desulfosediminicola flagellatus]|uniref:hypothetical protein n=1 Tax=Desulfosediminicola flagellatus TaxID=2569541 RepID=UPI0010AD6555|nr:hypothetical protein [Desulfosediminicola flagellatus]